VDVFCHAEVGQSAGVATHGMRFLSAFLKQSKQVAQLSQRNRAAAWVSFGWVVDDGVGQ